mmetsp:Transcript_55635/g.124142  ORF Transcript_55635/g.124142 Transcript_55635/m.124142 type:complete len:556 (+) Transcript_55635:29-1696(+)
MASLDSARLSLAKGAPEETLREAREVAAAARSSGASQLVVESVSLQSLALLATGRAVEAEQLLGSELNTCRGSGDHLAEATLLVAQSNVSLASGDASKALRFASEGRLAISRKGSASEKQHRLLLVRLWVAEANAHLTGSAAAKAAQAACEALTLARQSQNEDGECEALHVMVLLYLFCGRTAAKTAVLEAAKGEHPFASLESANSVARLFRKMGNKEGEAAALLFGVAEARLAEGNPVEAQGAARRSRDLFRQLRHRRGRLAALEILASSLGLDTLGALEAAEEELRLFAAEADTAGQVSALRILADVYISAKIYGEARSAVRKAANLLKGTASEPEAQNLLLLAEIEDFMGRTDASLEVAQKALTVAKTAKANSLATEARQLVSRLHVKSGRAEEAPNRRSAVEALRELTDALARRDADEFKSTMKRLEELSGYTDAEVKAALILEDDPDQEGLLQFLKRHGQSGTSSRGAGGSVVMTGLSHALLYLSFRMGGLGYGPRFRRCRAYKVEGVEDTHAVAYLRLLSSQEEWGRRLETQPPILDSMQHSLNAIAMA